MLLYLLYKEGRTPLCITITIVLSERLVHMERQCWANVQYSWRECGTIVGILSSIYHDQLEESVCKLFDKLNCNIVKDYLGDCHRLRDDRAIVKFFKRKDCKQVLSVKNELKNISMALDLRKMVRFILIKVYALTTKCCGHGAKSYTTWEEFTAGMCLVVQSK